MPPSFSGEDMDARSFLASVVPAEGKMVVMTLDANKKAKNRFFDDREKALQHALKSSTTHDVYFACATFNANRRRQDNAANIKTLYVDIDVGEAKTYKTVDEAILALKKFLGASGFPTPSVIVFSGYGLHVYWIAPMTMEQWTAAAANMRAWCEHEGLGDDYSITTDSARVLRVPGTYNYKDRNDPKPVRVLLPKQGEPHVYDLSALTVAPPTKPLPSLTVIQGAGAGVNDDLSGGVDRKPSGPFYFEYIGETCEVMKEALANGGADINEGWNRYLLLAGHCEDGRKYAHLISKGHIEYVEKETERKFNQKVRAIERDGIGPTLCKTFALYNPEACARCKFRSPSLASPLFLGLTKYTGVPIGFMKDEDGVYYKDGDKWERFLPFEITSAEPVWDRETQEVALHLRMKDTKKAYQLTLPYSQAAKDERALSRTLGKYGIVLPPHTYKHLTRFTVSWLTELSKNRRVRAPYQHMGWVNDTEFAVSDQLYDANGPVADTISDIDDSMLDIFGTQGDIDTWRKAAQHVIDNGCPSLAILIASAFAAPLMRFTPVPSCVLAFVSALSGQGKTTAMNLSQAVWGDPIRATNTLDDTTASVIHRMGKAPHYPAYWDELQSDHVKKFNAEVTFRLAQGKEKSRLSSTAELRSVTSWNTLMMVASNVSVLDQALHDNSSTNAGIMRIMEFDVGGFTATPNGVKLLTNAARQNYGHAGRVYGEFLAKRSSTLGKDIEELHGQLTAKLQASPDTRFWVAGMTTILKGAKYAGEAGLLSFPIQSMLQELVKVYRAQLRMVAEEVQIVQTDDERLSALINEFTNDMLQNGMVTSALHTGSGRPQNIDQLKHIIGQHPRGKLCWQRSHNPAVLRVSRHEFRDWLSDRSQHALKDMKLILTTFGATQLKSRLGIGTPYESPGRITCIDIPLTHPALSMDD